jgi:hypothetical protein
MGDLREVLEPGRAFGQVPLKPAQRRPLELRRSTLGVQVEQLESVFEGQVGSSRAASSAIHNARRSIARRKQTKDEAFRR